MEINRFVISSYNLVPMLRFGLSKLSARVSTVLIYILFIVSIFSCKKNDFAERDTNLKDFKVLTLNTPVVIPGNKTMLMISVSSVYQMVLTDNRGNEIWNREVHRRYNFNGAVAESGGIYTIADGADRIRMSENGTLVKRDTNFFSEISSNIVSGLLLKPNGNYVFWGRFSNTIPYNGMVCEIDTKGAKVFKTITSSNTDFTDCKAQNNGNLLLFGKHTNILQGTPFRFLVASLDSKGKILFSKFVETSEINTSVSVPYQTTYEMQQTDDDNFIGISTGVSGRMSLIKFSGAGLLQDTLSLHQYGSKSGSLFRQKNGNFAIMLQSSTSNIPGLGSLPTSRPISTLVEFNDQLLIINSIIYNQGGFGIIAANSDGDLVATGRIMSFERDYKTVMMLLK